MISESDEKVDLAPLGHDARSTMYYDPLSTDGLCYVNLTHIIWSFNVDAKKWTKLKPTGDTEIPQTKQVLVSYFDPARNVYVVIGDNWVWCYRYKK